MSFMRAWIDLANSPHVPLFHPVVDELRRRGWEFLLTARDHAQTAALASKTWPDVIVVGGESPGGRAAKARAIGSRAEALRRFARRHRPDVALSHGSYGQIVAARAAGIPSVTMMDYEHQPANHLSFRLAHRIVVPTAFPAPALRRFGARSNKVLRYAGFKEELYLAGFQPDPSVLERVGVELTKVVAVMRPPPDGALYHRHVNHRFEALVELARSQSTVQTILLPRTPAQRERYERLANVKIPEGAIDAQSLLSYADLAIGAGGTVNRESALLGTPTYTVFSGRLAAVDAALIREGKLHDLRANGREPRFEKKPADARPPAASRRAEILHTVAEALESAIAL
jgi:uncharacterized protein